MVWGVTGCHKTAAQSSAVAADQNPGDPADANLAPAQVLGQSAQNEAQQQAEDYTPQQQDAPGYYDNGQPTDQEADAYASDLTDEEASEPPPLLPEYDQPPAPDPDYMWTPGYWAWGPGGYYWVPGCWVAAPYVGALWTPGYWGFVGGHYRFHHGFWGRHIGFYGGIDYGYGYTGYGYYGGYWNGGHFFYNTAVNRVNRNVIRNVYDHNVVVNHRTENGGSSNRVSFNGGRGGVQERPRPAELAVLHEQRNAPMASQVQVARDASRNKQQFFKQNNGRPAVEVNTHAVVADRTPPKSLPRATEPVGQPAGRGEVRPGQFQAPAQAGRPPGQPTPQVRNVPEAARPGPEGRQVPQNRTQEVRPVHPQPEARPVQPQLPARPQPQPRPQEQARPQPQVRPQEQTRPQEQARPPEQARPQEQAHPQPPARQQEARPQPQARPQRAAPSPRPQSEARPASPPHPQPQHDDSHRDDKPHQ
jgi:hypothetical protein